MPSLFEPTVFQTFKKFPVDYVKTDGKIIQNLTNDEMDQVLMRSMYQIATKLGKKPLLNLLNARRHLN